MNVLLAVGGAAATLLVAVFIVIWVVDGIRAAAYVVGGTIATVGVCLTITVFWIWVAGGFA